MNILITILAFVFLFMFFLFMFTIIPRIIFTFMQKIFTYDKTKGLLKNYTRVFIPYFILAIPITIILYQASAFGNRVFLQSILGNNLGATLFLFSIILFSILRLALLAKKRVHLSRSTFLSKFFSSFPQLSNKDRKEFHQEYFSFIFSLIFASFFFGMVILMFNAFFLKNNNTLDIPAIGINLPQVIGNILGCFFIYALIAIAVTFTSELIISICGQHELED